jgi:hypothetical protein
VLIGFWADVGCMDHALLGTKHAQLGWGGVGGGELHAGLSCVLTAELLI